ETPDAPRSRSQAGNCPGPRAHNHRQRFTRSPGGAVQRAYRATDRAPEDPREGSSFAARTSAPGRQTPPAPGLPALVRCRTLPGADRTAGHPEIGRTSFEPRGRTVRMRGPGLAAPPAWAVSRLSADVARAKRPSVLPQV